MKQRAWQSRCTIEGMLPPRLPFFQGGDDLRTSSFGNSPPCDTQRLCIRLARKLHPIMWRTLAVVCAVRPMVNMTAAVADEWDRERRQDWERNGTGPTSLSSLLAPTFLHAQDRCRVAHTSDTTIPVRRIECPSRRTNCFA